MDPMKDMSSEKVCYYVLSFWNEMKRKGTIDAARESYEESVRKARRLVSVNTVEHTDALYCTAGCVVHFVNTFFLKLIHFIK